MQNYTPLIPGIYLCLFLAIYLFYPQEKRSEIQARIKSNLNFLLICNIILVICSIIAAVMLRTLVPDYLAWAALVILVAISLWKLLAPTPPAPDDSEDVDVLKGMKF